MANTPSAIKRMRQSEAARLRNAAIRSRVRTEIKKVRKALDENNLEIAEQQLRVATKYIDKAATKGVLKANTASRKIGRLTRAVNAARSQATPAQ